MNAWLATGCFVWASGVLLVAIAGPAEPAWAQFGVAVKTQCGICGKWFDGASVPPHSPCYDKGGGGGARRRPVPNTYGVVALVNETNRNITYSITSYGGGGWLRETVKPGRGRSRWWRPAADFHVRFTSDGKTKAYRLDANVIHGRVPKYEDGRKYYFWDGGGRLGLYQWSQRALQRQREEEELHETAKGQIRDADAAVAGGDLGKAEAILVRAFTYWAYMERHGVNANRIRDKLVSFYVGEGDKAYQNDNWGAATEWYRRATPYYPGDAILKAKIKDASERNRDRLEDHWRQGWEAVQQATEQAAAANIEEAVTVFSEALISDWRTALGVWTDLEYMLKSSHRSGSHAQANERLLKDLSAAIGQFDRIIGEAEGLRKHGESLRMDLDRLRQQDIDRTSSAEVASYNAQVEKLREGIASHNKGCASLRVEVQSLQTDLKALAPTIHNILNSSPSSWTIEARDGGALAIDSSGSKRNVPPAGPFLRGVVYESEHRLQLKRSDSIEFNDELLKHVVASHVAPKSQFRFDVKDGVEYLTVLKGQLRQVVDVYSDKADAAAGMIRKETGKGVAWVKKQLTRRWRVKMITCAIAPRGTDFVVDVESDSRTVVSVVSGEVEVTFPSGWRSVLPPPTISAGQQLVIDRSHLEGKSTYDDTSQWRVTLNKEIGATKIEQQWREEFGEPLSSVAKAKNYAEDAAAFADAGDYDKAIEWINKAIRELIEAGTDDLIDEYRARRRAYADLRNESLDREFANLPVPGTEKEVAKLQGSWIIRSARASGKPMPYPVIARMEFKGSQTRLTSIPDEHAWGPFKIDLDASPKRIDVRDKWHKSLGVYAMDGDELKICFGSGAYDKPARPRGLESESGTKEMSFVLTRLTKEQRTRTDKEFDRFQGTWVVQSMTHGGAVEPLDGEYSMEFKGNKVTLHDKKNGRSEDKGTFDINVVAYPRQIDIYEPRTEDATPAGEEDEQSEDQGIGERLDWQPGIYQFDGDSLKMCFEEGKKDARPTALTSQKGTDQWSVVLKRSTESVHSDEAIRLNANDVDAYFGRGVAHKGRGEFVKAIADFTEAIRLDPHHAEAYYNRGLAHFYEREYDKAIADFSEAIRIKPDFAAAYFNRAAAYKRVGNTDKAGEDDAKARELGYEYYRDRKKS